MGSRSCSSSAGRVSVTTTFYIHAGVGDTQARLLVRTGTVSGSGTTVYNGYHSYNNGVVAVSLSLSPNTTYTYNVKYNIVYDYDYEYDDEGNITGSTITGEANNWAGGVQFTTPGLIQNWTWSSVVSPRHPINISALDWNNFCTRINQFRAYKGLGGYSFTTVYPGTPISANIYMQAWNAINSISDHGTMPPTAISGTTTITAYHFTQLRDALNVIY